MRRQISSSITAATKLFILFFGGIIIPSAIIYQLFKLFSASFFIYAIFLCLLSLFVVRWALRWVDVELEEDGLRISRTNFGFRREIFVEFDQIDNVRQEIYQMLGTMETVSIILKEKSELGRIVKFMPKSRFFNIGEHSIVQELKTVIASKSKTSRS